MPSAFLAGLSGLPCNERRARAAALIADEFRSALLMDADDVIDVDANLFDLGLTSLGLETLKQRLQAAFDCPLHTNVLFNHPTIRQFTAAMERQLSGDDASSPDPGPQHQDRSAVEALIAGLYQQA